jgi:ATP-dependent Clp protease ATP-binding subunit ClpA
MTILNDSADSLFLPDGSLRQELLGEGAPAVLREAVRQAEETNWDSIRTPHLFMGLLAMPDAGIREWGKRLGASLPTLLGQFRDLFTQDARQRPIGRFSREFLSDDVVALLGAARSRAMSLGRSSLTPLDLLIALYATKTIVAECFERLGISAEQLVDLAIAAEQKTPK